MKAFLESVSSENIFLEYFSQVKVFLENVLGISLLERAFWESAVLESVLESFFSESVALGRVFDGMLFLERWDAEQADEEVG